MKKFSFILIAALLLSFFSGCAPAYEQVEIAATTLPVYEFTARLCEGTDISIGRVVTESISCLHDYSLQTKQMRMVEGADLLIISGAGLEDFLDTTRSVCDASKGIDLLCSHSDHHHDDHSHEQDPHIWLDPVNAAIMARNIYSELNIRFPQYNAIFSRNLDSLILEFDQLQAYGEETLKDLSSRELITFHDGFAYFANTFELSIVKSVEEESGSEASAAELIELIELVKNHAIPAVFTEVNGSVSAAQIVSAETGISVFALDMAMGDRSYFEAMYHNIDTIKEALG